MIKGTHYASPPTVEPPPTSNPSQSNLVHPPLFPTQQHKMILSSLKYCRPEQGRIYRGLNRLHSKHRANA